MTIDEANTKLATACTHKERAEACEALAVAATFEAKRYRVLASPCCQECGKTVSNGEFCSLECKSNRKHARKTAIVRRKP